MTSERFRTLRRGRPSRGAWALAAASILLVGCGHPSADLPVLPATVDGTSTALPVVQVTVGGRTLLALIDTGTSGVVVSSKLYGVDDGSMLIQSICFGAVCTNNLWVEARETLFSSIDGIQMIVGMTALGTQPLELDHLQSVRLGALPGDFDAPAIPFVIDSSGRPFVAAIQIAGTSTPSALIDTGSVFSLLDSASSQDLPNDARAEATPATGCSVNGCTSGFFVATSPTMCVGPSCAENVPVKYPAYVAVGISFLSRYRARFDFSGNTLRLCDETSPPEDAGASAAPPAEGSDGGSE